ncbi:MAG: hypothetical protein LBH22_04395 [Bacteroidales bacterium]|jgi:hypothetical protein|nr:hypothetical protein [Bacteroidales bacterium]
METIKLDENFSCIEMKRQIQAKIYAETKGMTTEELLAYYHIPPDQDPYRGNSKKPKPYSTEATPNIAAEPETYKYKNQK